MIIVFKLYFLSTLKRKASVFEFLPSNLKSAVFLFLRFSVDKGLTTLICHENGAFRKRSSNRRNLKTPAFRFRVDGKILETQLFENDGVTTIL